MNRYANIRLSDWLINITNQEIYVYDVCTGDICEFAPIKGVLPESPEMENGLIVHYIVDKKMAEQLREVGRSLDDIAIVKSSASGRDGFIITQLAWGNDPKMSVELFYDAHKFLFM